MQSVRTEIWEIGGPLVIHWQKVTALMKLELVLDLITVNILTIWVEPRRVKIRGLKELLIFLRVLQ